MATLSITIQDEQVDRIIDALCATGHWNEAMGDRRAFARAEIRQMIRVRVMDYEKREALAAVPDPPDLEM